MNTWLTSPLVSLGRGMGGDGGRLRRPTTNRQWASSTSFYAGCEPATALALRGLRPDGVGWASDAEDIVLGILHRLTLSAILAHAVCPARTVHEMLHVHPVLRVPRPACTESAAHATCPVHTAPIVSVLAFLPTLMCRISMSKNVHRRTHASL